MKRICVVISIFIFFFVIPTKVLAASADLNGDGKVDSADYNLLLNNFGKSGTGITGDINGDGTVNIYDYNLLLSSWGVVPTPTPVTTPLPSGSPLPPSNPPQSGKPIVGAIRWDDWYGNLDEVGQATLTTLGPSVWHYRVPFFGKIISDTQVSWGYSQATIDQEIAYAKQAGLNYWAFGLNLPSNPISNAFNYYLSSSHKSDINFALIASPQSFGDDTYGMRPFIDAKKQRFLTLLSDSNYQKVLGNRPLIYLYGVYDAWITTWGGKNMLDQLRTAAVAQGLGNPYVVVMDFDPNEGKSWQQALGADAIATYASANCGVGTTYQSLISPVNGVEGFWNVQKNTGANVIPLAMAGWDRRPRVQNPTILNPGEQAGVGIETYCQEASPQELANHVMDAVNWVKNNPAADPANAVLIYAWNENDEGGWLTPTLSEGTARIDALASVLVSNSKNAGDLNGDGKVDSADLNILLGNFGKSGQGIAGDLNGDGAVNLYDYNNLLSSWGSSALPVPMPQKIGWWKFDESSGNAADSSGNNLTGTPVGTSIVAGKYGNARSFTSSKGDYINIPDNAIFNKWPNITASAWINMTSLPPAGSYYAPITKEGAFRFIIDSAGVAHFTVATVNNGWYSPGTVAQSAVALKTGTWSHIAGTYDGARVRIYINGVLQGTTTQNITGNILNNSNSFTISMPSFSVLKPFSGLIDNVKLYKAALTVIQIQSDMNP